LACSQAHPTELGPALCRWSASGGHGLHEPPTPSCWRPWTQPAGQPAKLAAAKKEADEETRSEKLDRRRKTTAPVPAVEAVTWEELPSARARQPKEVLEVGSRSGEGAGHRRVEGSAHRGEEQDCGDARAGLEAAVGDVTVRHPIAGEVEEHSEWQRAEPGTDKCAADSTGRNVKGDDQAASLASRAARARLQFVAPEGQ
jgi:hypothetical protein